MKVKIVPHKRRALPDKLADVELHFTDGPLEGMKLVGFAIWALPSQGDRTLTFPARTYTVNGGQHNYALLRPLVDTAGYARLRDMILTEYDAHVSRGSG